MKVLNDILHTFHHFLNISGSVDLIVLMMADDGSAMSNDLWSGVVQAVWVVLADKMGSFIC